MPSRSSAKGSRRLYSQMDWIEDTQRRRATGIPEGMTFATKPEAGARRELFTHRTRPLSS
jgi:hypothetical protein